MFVFKVFLSATVLLTMGSSLISSGSTGVVPYFPIEISRCASASERSLWIFRIGSILTSLMLFYERGFWNHLVACFGFIMLAWFDDVNYYVLHVAGVLIMMLGAIPLVSWRVTACALLVFGIRIVMKILMIVSFEKRDPFVIFDQIRMIMLNGAPHSNPAWDDAISVFRVTGAMQWISFYLLMNSF